MRCLAVFVFGVALFAPSAGAQYAYTCTTNSNISVVNTFTNASTATLTAGTQPLAIAVNPAGSYASTQASQGADCRWLDSPVTVILPFIHNNLTFQLQRTEVHSSAKCHRTR
jgi:YVTN family beta-propeller protein